MNDDIVVVIEEATTVEVRSETETSIGVTTLVIPVADMIEPTNFELTFLTSLL
jgi:hypothetical protein